MQSDSTTDYKKDKVNREKFKITSLGNSNFKTFNQTHVSQTLYVQLHLFSNVTLQ